MKYLITVSTFFVILFNSVTVQSQDRATQFDVEVEPVAYILAGAGIHFGVQPADWKYTLEMFGLNIPESLHGNEGFDASVLGAELHFEYFLTDRSPGGFFVGPEISFSRLEVTHRESGIREDHNQFSAGLRGGYRWYTGLGDLYVSPTAGVVTSLNSKDFEIEGEAFKTGTVTPFATVGIGWSF